jgi:hypothetical protein
VTEVIANEFERMGAAVSFEVVVDGSQHRPGDIAVKCVEADWRCDGSAYECFDVGVGPLRAERTGWASSLPSSLMSTDGGRPRHEPS